MLNASSTPLRTGKMRRVPRYALYGDSGSVAGHLHVERIPERSASYQWEIQPHTHEALVQVLWLQTGTCEVQLGAWRQPVQAPCVILVPAQTVHGFQFQPTSDGPVVTASLAALEQLSRVLMPELRQHLRQAAVLPLAADSQAAVQLAVLFAALQNEWRLHAWGQTAAGLSLLVSILTHIARLRPLGPGQSGGSGERTTNSSANGAWAARKAARVEQFRSLVDQHWSARWPLSLYAQAMGISVGQLSRLCRELLGNSAQGVLNARVLLEAQRELTYTNAPITRVAHALGFVDEAYFGRFFRKHSGQTPRGFRSRAQQRLYEGL